MIARTRHGQLQRNYKLLRPTWAFWAMAI
jgi:hypothetical protein